MTTDEKREEPREMKCLDDELLARLRAEAEAAPRRRAHHALHPAPGDPIQRLCMALEPGTYVRPHRHPEAGKFELLIALAGAVALLDFDAGGRVLARTDLSAGGPVHAVEAPPGSWHTLTALSTGTVVLEIKPGPYTPAADKEFADWAPPEGDPRAARFEAWARDAQPGARAPWL